MLPSHGVPDGEAWFPRQIAALQTALREGLASVAKSLAPQVEFLLNQTVSAEAAPGSLTTMATNPAAANVADTWVAFDAAADAQVTITTSSTGRVAVQAGGYLWLYSKDFATARGFIGVEILNSSGGVVRSPANGDGNLATVWGANNTQTQVSTGHRHEWPLTPNTQYTLRCRRGYAVGAGSATSAATTAFQGTALSVSLIGM